MQNIQMYKHANRLVFKNYKMKSYVTNLALLLQRVTVRTRLLHFKINSSFTRLPYFGFENQPRVRGPFLRFPVISTLPKSKPYVNLIGRWLLFILLEKLVRKILYFSQNSIKCQWHFMQNITQWIPICVKLLSLKSFVRNKTALLDQISMQM